jgi:hypothetical protein
MTVPSLGIQRKEHTVSDERDRAEVEDVERAEDGRAEDDFEGHRMELGRNEDGQIEVGRNEDGQIEVGRNEDGQIEVGRNEDL